MKRNGETGPRAGGHPGRLAFALLALPLAVAGCGGGSGGTVSTRPSTSASGGGVTQGAGAGGAGTDLTVVVDDGTGKTTTWHLTCDPPGGDHPDPARACQVLEQNGAKALPPVPKDQMCTQIYGGPQTAKITGSWKGKQVDASLKRTNGCETGRWQALAGLLPAAADKT